MNLQCKLAEGDEQIKSKCGPGSKNKKTLAREAAGELPETKRKRGRSNSSREKIMREGRKKAELGNI